jgi:hypothetical protein
MKCNKVCLSVSIAALACVNGCWVAYLGVERCVAVVYWPRVRLNGGILWCVFGVV